MALIKPFRAWHYHPERVAVDRVIAPPYDVISETDKDVLHQRDPHNVIRLILGQPKPNDPLPDSRYEEARKCLDRWTRQKILVRDSKEGFYLHEMSYRHPFLKSELSRLALFALLRLEPFDRKTVFRHEQTHSLPKRDRGKLLRATRANFSPVFTLYEDPSRTLDQIRKTCDPKTPLFDFSDDGSVHQRLWMMDRKEDLALIASAFDRKRIFIADGHHRYETALAYAQEMRKKTLSRGDHGWEYVMSAFVRASDPGLLILPIHRVVLSARVGSHASASRKPIPMEREAFLAGLKKHFVLHPVSRSVLEKISEGTISEGFGFAFSESECYLLELKDRSTASQAMPSGKAERWYELDVNLVSFLILEPLLGIGETRLEERIFYTPDLNEAFRKLREGEASCAFFIRPVTAPMIKEICELGELMPQKSTYFYPKFPSGLLIYRH